MKKHLFTLVLLGVFVILNGQNQHKSAKGSMGLAKITKYDRDDEKGICYKYVYEVKNGIKKLLSKTESSF